MDTSKIAVPVTRKKLAGKSRAKKAVAEVKVEPAAENTGPAARRTRIAPSSGGISPAVRASSHRLASVERSHKYRVGQTVTLTFNATRPGGGTSSEFTVTARLPVQGPSLQYRVRNENEPYERVVVEEDLAAVE